MLPPQVWQMILRYSISVAEFFDPNIVDRMPLWCIRWCEDWNDPKQYWITERIRNNLRTVCRSWDAYLHPLAHRFVHMDDVVHGLVPAHYL
jgi:hypothetical protein